MLVRSFVAELPWTASRRRYGLLHRRRRSRLDRVRHRRRTQPRISLPQYQPLPPSRLHPPHAFQSDAMGSLKSRGEPASGSPILFPLFYTRSIQGARAEAVPSSDSSVHKHCATHPRAHLCRQPAPPLRLRHAEAILSMSTKQSLFFLSSHS